MIKLTYCIQSIENTRYLNTRYAERNAIELRLLPGVRLKLSVCI